MDHLKGWDEFGLQSPNLNFEKSVIKSIPTSSMFSQIPMLCNVVHGILCALYMCTKYIVLFLKHLFNKKKKTKTNSQLNLFANKKPSRFNKTWFSMKLFGMVENSTLNLSFYFYLFTFGCAIHRKQTFNCMPITRTLFSAKPGLKYNAVNTVHV